MSTQIGIEISHLSFSYSGDQKDLVFRGASARFLGGDISAIVGHSGSGKSTLLALLAGLIGFNDQDSVIKYGPLGLTPSQMIRKGRISLCMQKPACLPWATVYDNVIIAFRLQGAPVDRSIATSLLERFGLTPYRDFYPSSLSLGMQSRLALARAFATQPQVLLLDEPFASLDVGWKEQLYKFLVDLQSEQRCTVVLVTHDLPEALSLAGTIFSIKPKSKQVQLVIENNPLADTQNPRGLASLVHDPQFPTYFQYLHESITSNPTL